MNGKQEKCVLSLSYGKDSNLNDTKKSPLVEAGWTESDCRTWCERHGLLSPIYTTENRGGGAGFAIIKALRHSGGYGVITRNIGRLC